MRVCEGVWVRVKAKAGLPQCAAFNSGGMQRLRKDGRTEEDQDHMQPWPNLTGRENWNFSRMRAVYELYSFEYNRTSKNNSRRRRTSRRETNWIGKSVMVGEQRRFSLPPLAYQVF